MRAKGNFLFINRIQVHLRYPDQYFDAATELFYNWHRYYDASIGRYVTADPHGLIGGLNIYLYAKANPLRFIDRLGLGPPPKGTRNREVWDRGKWGRTAAIIPFRHQKRGASPFPEYLIGRC